MAAAADTGGERVDNAGCVPGIRTCTTRSTVFDPDPVLKSLRILSSRVVVVFFIQLRPDELPGVLDAEEAERGCVAAGVPGSTTWTINH